MNLEESNEIFQKNKQKNTKKQAILGGIVLCVSIIIICFVSIFVLNAKESARFKMFVNGQEVPISQNLYTTDESNQTYFNIKQLAYYTGYKYTQGDYIEVNEDKNSCYIESDYEIVTFKADENVFYKYAKNKNTVVNSDEEEEKQTNNNVAPQSGEQTQEKPVYVVKSEDGEKEIYSIETPIKIINEQLYIPQELVKTAFNSTIELEEKSLNIYSLDYLVKFGQNIAAKQGYSTISSNYENLRAIANNMLVLGNGEEYGVLSLETGKIIVSVRYDDIKYMQSEDKFYVYLDSKVGIIDSEGNTIIAAKDYDSIVNFDMDQKIYLAKKDGKFGLINSEGEPILHTDFDAIGLNDIDKFNVKDFKNENLWFDEIVAVKKGSTYGLYNIKNKEEVLAATYDGFGYKTTTTDTSGEENTLIIPGSTGVEGIVVSTGGLYGIYDINLKAEVIPCLCTRIYSITKNGVTTYYMEFNGSQLEMKEYFTTHNMVTAQ